MMTRRTLAFPARIHPRLPGGAIHRIELDDVEMRIATIAGLYGNRKSRVVLTVPHWRLVGAEYVPPEVLSGQGLCRVRYLDEKTEEHSISMAMADTRLDGSIYARGESRNQYVERVARALEQFRRGGADLPDLPSLDPRTPGRVGSIAPWIILAAGFGLAAWSQIVENPLLSLGSCTLGLAILAGLAINRVRSHTPYHPVVKWILYAFVLVGVAALLVAALAWGDFLNLR
jgi:hypothetical protein